jgi:hypothetical protein
MVYKTDRKDSCSSWHTEPQNKMFVVLVLGRAIAQAVSHRPLTAEALVRAWVSPCGICGG